MQAAVDFHRSRAGPRDVTMAAHTRAVESAIWTMQSQLREALTLEDLASVACLSTAHFSRVFRRLIGIPPVEYLSALRFQRARQLLLMTTLTSADICFEVGFTSPGTFSSRFTHRVGLSPRQLRQRAQAFEPVPAAPAARRPLDTRGAPGRCQFHGCVDAPTTFQGTIYLGLFSGPIPQGKPVRCTRLEAPGRYLLPDVADGVYYLRAAAFPLATDPIAALLPAEKLLLGNNSGPLRIHHGRITGDPNLALHPPRVGDPPLVMGLPLL